MRFMVDQFHRGGVFRARENEQTAGGKGLNVTRVLAALGAPVTATGLLGGSNGQFIRRELAEAGIDHSFVEIAGNTRTCIAVLERMTQTEVLGRGPKVTAEELALFLDKFGELARRASVVTMSGSLPLSVPTDIYRKLVAMAKSVGCKVLLDTSGQPLYWGMKASPFLIKPNQDELAAAVGTALTSEEEVGWAAKELAAAVEAVVVSRGRAGALALIGGKLYRVSVPAVEAINPVGSGDAMLAGLAWGLHEEWELEQILAFGTACGVANALEMQTGCVDPDRVREIEPMVKVKQLTPFQRAKSNQMRGI